MTVYFTGDESITTPQAAGHNLIRLGGWTVPRHIRQKPAEIDKRGKLHELSMVSGAYDKGPPDDGREY